ncbi:MAG TPA: hypothetical protein VF323_08510 [Candidatus Limnocylindrales bacterium]
MSAPELPPPTLDPPVAAALLANLGFLASSDLPARPGPAYLLVALRPTPTLHHYDPERVDYWATVAGRGTRRTLAREATVPAGSAFSWGLIRIVDRLQVTNEYLTFGGELAVGPVGDTTIAVFTSPAPLLRRGGHSQGWDHGAQSVGAFFGRLLVAVDYIPRFETLLAAASPLARYSAFVREEVERYRMSAELRSSHAELWTLLETEERRLQREQTVAWTEGAALLREAEFTPPVAHPGG